MQFDDDSTNVTLVITMCCADLSTSSLHGDSVLRSPYKGAVLPVTVSTTVSPLVRHSLGSLPSSLRHPTGAPSFTLRHLVSPQITKWFRKSTPRKLAVTPKKSSSIRDSNPTVAGVKRKLCSESDVDDSLGVTPIARKPKMRRPSRENDRKLSPSKPQRTESSTLTSVLSPVESNCSKQMEQVLVKTLNNGSNAAIQSSVISCAATTFRSPTVNLPNYVYDPQPRAPVGRHSSPVKRRQSVDWLTQFRLERRNNQSRSSPSAGSPTGRGGQTKCKTAKKSKSSPRVSRSDASAVRTSTHYTEVLDIYCFSCHSSWLLTDFTTFS